MVEAGGVTPLEGKQQIASFVADHLEALARR
jgi:hypothetical protein